MPVIDIDTGGLRKELDKQYQLFSDGRWAYCKEQAERHRRRLGKVVGVAFLINVIGFCLMVAIVSEHVTSKKYALLATGFLMIPVGWALNKLAFRNKDESERPDKRRVISVFNWPVMFWRACKARKEKFSDGVLDDVERWLIKVTTFALLGHGSWQLMVTLLNWNYLYVKVGQFCILSPLSLAANYWVFHRKKEARYEPHLEAVTESP
jgi:hypothetical protein